MSYWNHKHVEIDAFKGLIFSDVVGTVGGDEIKFNAVSGETYVMYHENDCCESVYVEDIAGDLSDLIGSPIIEAECVTNSDNPPSEWTESHTWTFYKLGTAKGHVTLRWLGESNGYYSESVSIRIN